MNCTTIASVTVENYRRLTAARLEFVPGTGLVRVTGKNASGKTSLLKAIAGALGGKALVHEGSLHEGTEKGLTRIELTNGYTIERRVTEASPKGYLTITSPDGGKYNQTTLSAWLGERSFDPLAFLSLTPDRQRDVLFSIGKDQKLPEKLQKVRDRHARTYASRTPLISDLRALRKQTRPMGDRPEPVDTSEEMAKLRELRDEQEARDEARNMTHEARDAADDLAGAITSTKHRIDDLKRELEAELKTLAGLDRQYITAAEQATRQEKEYAELADPADDIATVEASIMRATEVQAALEPWKQWDKAVADQDHMETVVAEHTAELKHFKQKEADLLAGAGIPVEGLSFGEDGEPQLHGRPLALASGREKIDLAVDVAFAAEPEVRVCLLDEANDLDIEAMEQLDKRARDRGFQVWAVRLGLEGDGEVVVEDGVAASRAS